MKNILYGLIAVALFFPWLTEAQSNRQSSGSDTNDPIARIREEGLTHSQVMETLTMLTDIIGPRLTGSPNLKRANEWTRDTLKSWGCINAHLEAWGPFGRGWSLERFSAQLIEPNSVPLIAFPNAWSPGFTEPLVAPVVYFDGATNEMEKLKGKLEGKIVLVGARRELTPRFDPLASRVAETNLLKLANMGDPHAEAPFFGMTAGAGPGRFGARNADGVSNRLERVVRRGADDSESGTNAPGAGPGGRSRGGFRGRFGMQSRSLAFLAKEKAALAVLPSNQGDGGTLFVSGASVPGQSGFGSGTNSIRAWATNVPAILPQITMAAEDFNRLARMCEHGESLKMAVDLKVKFYADDLMAYNTIAELPGTDLKNEVVMLGAHLDSWHSATGATDNAAGVAAAMETLRIMSTLQLHPRRTIRLGLWTGEEQGLLGSKAYVAKHFGYYTNSPSSSGLRSPKDRESEQPAPKSPDSTNTPPRRLVKGPEYDTLSAYFNLDNGAGKIRGVYMQGNEAVRPLFRRWLEPFADLGAETLTLSNTGGTDHTSFDSIGLPGFQFIQDPIDYWTRTHHSNQDLYDRVPPDDLKQAATILACFVYDAAMADKPLPRKELER